MSFKELKTERLTGKGLLGFTAELSNSISIAVTLVQNSLDDFIPGVPNLVESSCFRLLALI